MRRSALVAMAVCCTSLVAFSATAQEANSIYQGDIRDIRIGLTAEDFPDGYYDPSCGTNGGPPSIVLDDWTDFATCRAEDNGLHEVYFTFDDELARIAEEGAPNGAADWVNNWSGTIVAGFPVIISVLFDDAGVVQGVRIITDPRADADARGDAYLFRASALRRFGAGGWQCTDIPLAEGETPLGDTSIKQHCVKHFPDRTMVMMTRLYRRPGQNGINDRGEFVEAEFESSTRLEIWAPELQVDINYDGILDDLTAVDRPRP